MTNIAIFVSGTGSNAENIILHFKESKKIKIKKILSNKCDCLAIKKSQKLGISTYIFENSDLRETNKVDELLESEKIDFIVLAGFLLMMPERVTKRYKNRIINLHPALLPSYGGEGMYGANVHKAVIAANEKESGITIHLVNEKFDDGRILFQAKCSVDSSDDYQSLAKKINKLEMENFPKAIEVYVENFVIG